MITLAEYESYFETLATRYKPIGHSPTTKRFATMDIDEILAASRSSLDLSGPTMILEHPEGRPAFRHEQIRDINLGAFLILKRIRIGDSDDRRATMDLCKSVGMALISEMQRQRLALFQGAATQPKLLHFFDLSDVSYQKVGPILADCYGWRFEIQVGQESQLIHNPDDWNP